MWIYRVKYFISLFTNLTTLSQAPKLNLRVVYILNPRVETQSTGCISQLVHTIVKILGVILIFGVTFACILCSSVHPTPWKQSIHHQIFFSFTDNSTFDQQKKELLISCRPFRLYASNCIISYNTCMSINLKCALWKEDFAQTKYSMRIIKVCACSCPDGNYTYFSCIEALSKNFFILSWHFFMTPTSYGIEMNK